jgi:hypothetical protein
LAMMLIWLHTGSARSAAAKIAHAVCRTLRM